MREWRGNEEGEATSLSKLVKLQGQRREGGHACQEGRKENSGDSHPWATVKRVWFSRARFSTVGLDLLRNREAWEGLTSRGCSDDLTCGVDLGERRWRGRNPARK